MISSHIIEKTGLLLISLLGIGCAGSDNRAGEEERYALLENQRIADERLKQENIRDALRAPMQPEPSNQFDIAPQQFVEWNFLLYPDPITTDQTCSLLSEVYDVMSGDLPTQVQVLVTQSSVFLRSDAVLSEDGLESGFRVDAQLPVAFDNMLNEVTARVDKGYSRLIDAMLAGTVLTTKFAYQSPEETPQEPHTIDMTLSEFGDAYKLFSLCE